MEHQQCGRDIANFLATNAEVWTPELAQSRSELHDRLLASTDAFVASARHDDLDLP